MDAVSFDLDGTLVRSAESREQSIDHARQVVDPALPRVPVDAYQTAFRDALRERLPNTAREMPVRRAAFERAFAERGRVPPAPTLSAFARAYRRRRLERLEQRAGAVEILSSVRESGGVTLIVTNGPAGLQREKLERIGLAKHVDAMAIAGRCGAAKPDPKPFEVALDRVDASADGTIHVGDAQEDVTGARRAGLDPVLLDPDGSRPDGSGPETTLTPRYRSLAAVSRRVLD